MKTKTGITKLAKGTHNFMTGEIMLKVKSCTAQILFKVSPSYSITIIVLKTHNTQIMTTKKPSLVIVNVFFFNYFYVAQCV